MYEVISFNQSNATDSNADNIIFIFETRITVICTEHQVKTIPKKKGIARTRRVNQNMALLMFYIRMSLFRSSNPNVGDEMC
jgi:hypothetical protein